MRILILNWRDVRNPEAGGAEILTQEMAKRWVKWGNKVIHFSSFFPKAKKEETIDGVKFIRRGSANLRSCRLPVHLAAFQWYQRHGRGQFDVVIDEIHGLPFFTPLYIKEKKVALICEVAHEIWDKNFRFPLNKIGRFIERHYFSFYQQVPFLTISPSTKKDLISMGIEEKRITVLPMGITPPGKLKKYPKEKSPTLIFAARLSKAKGIEDAIQVLCLVKKDYPKLQLWVIGQKNEEYAQELKNIVRKLDLQNNIKFYGFVSQEKKFELMSRAHLLIAPSIREGWGLTIPEAGAVGTAAVAYNVPGLQDVIKNDVNGILVKPEPRVMSQAVVELLHQPVQRRKLEQGARKEAKKYNWEKTARAALKALRLI